VPIRAIVHARSRLLLPAALLLGCGTSAGAGGDAASDSAAINEGIDGGSIGSGDGSSPSADVGASGQPADAGTGNLSGPQSFPVGRVIMGAITGGCEPDASAAVGIVPAVQIAFVEPGPASQQVCSTAAPPVDGGLGNVIAIGVATTQWAMYASAPLTESLTTGAYAVSNEHEDDEDLCMLGGAGSALRGPGTAYLLLTPYGGESLSIATSGTVTIDSVGATFVTGSFDVLIGGPYGQTDAGASPLSGTFSAAACP
jgi:hypothetical protein